MKSFGVPDVSFHPGSAALLPQLEYVEEKTELASMSATLRPLEDFTLVRVELVKGVEPYAHRDPVVIVSHAPSTQVPRDQLDLHL